MAGEPEIHDPAKYKDFHVHHETFKVVSGYPLDLTILIPKVLVEAGGSTEKVPLITEFHGGFLIGGNRIFSPWFSDWYVPELLKHLSKVNT